MVKAFQTYLGEQLAQIRSGGYEKIERIIDSPQGARVRVGGRDLLNLCSNNYLGLAAHPEVLQSAQRTMERWGYGLASVRFICGTQQLHRQLEEALTQFLSTEATILYGSCFDANGGLFETLFGSEDVILSDELNHASIIDGIRLSKARRERYRNNDMADLESKLQAHSAARFRLIVTDGVFSMDGSLADLSSICSLAQRYEAQVMVDDSHGVGVVGSTGRGCHEAHGVLGQIDILTGTLGKALGGASGGYTSGRREIIDLLRQRSRPYLFSNTLAPAIAGASLTVLELLSHSTALRDQLAENTRFFRQEMLAHRFPVLPGEHPIVPILLGDATLSAKVAEAMLAHGVYVVSFSYPVVPVGKARIRAQISAAHTRADLEQAISALCAVRREIGF